MDIFDFLTNYFYNIKLIGFERRSQLRVNARSYIKTEMIDLKTYFSSHEEIFELNVKSELDNMFVVTDVSFEKVNEVYFTRGSYTTIENNPLNLKKCLLEELTPLQIQNYSIDENICFDCGDEVIYCDEFIIFINHYKYFISFNKNLFNKNKPSKK
jgi:hypothetical protein